MEQGLTTSNGSSRDRLITAILDFLGCEDLLSRADITTALENEIDQAGPAAVLALRARLTADNGWDYYPCDPLARRIHQRLAGRFLKPDSQLLGTEHLAHVGDGPVIIFANHLSYADANVIEVLLQRSGEVALANRLTAVAGPKVYSNRERRFSSLCFGTIKVPQSADVASDEAVLNPREVARAARRALEVARARRDAGDALLLFGEGTRSRTGGMQPMLTGVGRYLDTGDTWVVPAGLVGPEQLFPVDGSELRPARVVLRFGCPIAAERLRTQARGDRRIVMDAIGLAIAELVPPPYRGVYASVAAFPEANAVLASSRPMA